MNNINLKYETLKRSVVLFFFWFVGYLGKPGVAYVSYKIYLFVCLWFILLEK